MSELDALVVFTKYFLASFVGQDRHSEHDTIFVNAVNFELLI